MDESMCFMSVVEEFGLHYKMQVDFKLRGSPPKYELSWRGRGDKQCTISVFCLGPGFSNSIRLYVRDVEHDVHGSPDINVHFADLLPVHDVQTARNILDGSRIACELLAELMTEDARFDSDRIVALIGDEDPLIRYGAVSLMHEGNFGETVPDVRDQLTHPDPVVRAYVGRYLIRSRYVEIRRAALALSDDPDPYVRGVVPRPPA